jgi:hypothetical protein
MRKLLSSQPIAILAGAVLAASFIGASQARASDNKFDIGFGFYAVTAKTSTGSGSTSGIGLYQLNYRRTISPKFEIAVGYTIYFSGLVSGDSGSGLDLGFNYYPFTFSGPIESNGPGAKMKMEELWRPYVGGTFNQRNFQSVQTTYTGFGIVLGVERVLNEKMNLNAVVRDLKLSGPKNSTGSELDFAVGVGFKF